MELNAEELKEIRRAKNDVMLWPYLRWVILAAGIGGLHLSFWLIISSSLEVLTSVQFHFSRAAVLGLTVALLTFPIVNWNNGKSKLLLKLASEIDVNSAK